LGGPETWGEADDEAGTMGEALGIDLRVAVCAAARRRGDEVAPCQLGDGTATAAAVDLMPVGAGAVADAVGATAAMLASVAGRALGGEPTASAETVAVAFAAAPDDGPRVLAQRAAAAAFPAPLLVPRPVAIAAWSLHHTPRPERSLLAVLDVDAGSVSAALVRRGRDGLDLVGRPAALPPAGDDVDLAAHLDGAVGRLLSIVAGAGLTPRDLEAVLLAGEPPWLDQLAVQAGVATGAATAIDPQPELAAALGAALLAGGPERRRLDPAGLALLGPGLVPHAAPDAAGGGLGDAVGDALGDALAGRTGDVGAGIGAMLQAAGGDGGAGGGLGDAAGGALDGADVHALAGPKDAPGQAAGTLSGPKDAPGEVSGTLSGPKEAPGGLPGRRAGGRGRLAAGALAAAVAVVVIGGAVAGSLGGGDDESAVETEDVGATEPDDEPTTTDDDDDDTTSTTGATTTVPGSTTLVDDDGDPATPPVPADPATGDPVPPTPGPGDPPATPGTTAAPGTTAPTTTAPRDTTPPTVDRLGRSPAQLTVDNGSEFCEYPKTGQAVAAVSDASGIKSVTLSYSGNGHSGGGSMSLSGASWTGTIGPFPQNQLGVGATATITWSVTATDNAGNRITQSGPTLTLHGC
jgi:hypothetical protein